ncbi:hypothetical protein RISK_001267 [Rhodopirellula islandica]|uniref:Uncharacterized protein n=1 Tax=Rhodopirellula islandica TaxID=595434 RepID=A0A0J1BJW0_RHOIS|nr:hypothetical protein RISK_001267 [Rhodopirellula islandica]
MSVWTSAGPLSLGLLRLPPGTCFSLGTSFRVALRPRCLRYGNGVSQTVIGLNRYRDIRHAS